jgi:hypothetical protein
MPISGHTSALDILPNVDKFLITVHDPMHLLLLGLGKSLY